MKKTAKKPAKPATAKGKYPSVLYVAKDEQNDGCLIASDTMAGHADYSGKWTEFGVYKLVGSGRARHVPECQAETNVIGVTPAGGRGAKR